MSNYGAGLLIYRPSDRKILLTRRSPLETSPGYWDFSGGHVEEGETYLEAALREGREELGGLPGLYIESEPFWWAPDPFFAFAVFLAQMDASSANWEPVLNDEHDRYGWFESNAIPRPALPGVLSGMRHFFGT